MYMFKICDFVLEVGGSIFFLMSTPACIPNYSVSCGTSQSYMRWTQIISRFNTTIWRSHKVVSLVEFEPTFLRAIDNGVATVLATRVKRIVIS